MSSDLMRVLQKREINWCESGHGYPASCPGPSDPPHYKYCCSFPYLGSYKPSCCMFPIMNEGILIICCVSCILIFTLFLALYCWCWPSSMLNKKRRLSAPPPIISQDEMFPRRNSYKSSIPFD